MTVMFSLAASAAGVWTISMGKVRLYGLSCCCCCCCPVVVCNTVAVTSGASKISNLKVNSLKTEKTLGSL